MQSTLSFSRLTDSDTKESKETLRYRQEIESYNALGAVMETLESPKSRKGRAVSESLDVSVPSWSDKKGHTEYLVSTALCAQPAGSIHTYHRFSDFITLHSRIREPLHLVRDFPVPKAPFVTDGVKRYRMRALQGYLRHAIDAAASRCGTRCEDMPVALFEFLGADALRPLLASLKAAAVASPGLALSSPPLSSPHGRTTSPDTIMASPTTTPARICSVPRLSALPMSPSKSGLSAQSVLAVAALAVLVSSCMFLLRLR